MVHLERATSGVVGPSSTDAFAGYRSATDRIVRRLIGSGSAADTARALPRLVEDEPDVGSLMVASAGSPGDTLERLTGEIERFRPTTRSNAQAPHEFARILLLQHIDVLWWSGGMSFADEEAVRCSDALVSLADLRRRGRLRFRYKVAARTLPARARAGLARRWNPDRDPRSSGLSHDRARPAMVALLEDVAVRFAEAAPGWDHGLWVNCILRSEAAQQHLRELGYSAFPRSSHCAGYAADLEMDWVARRGGAGALRSVLLGLRDVGVVNVIDEGQAWHVCLNPAWVAHYDRQFGAGAAVAEGDARCAG